MLSFWLPVLTARWQVLSGHQTLQSQVNITLSGEDTRLQTMQSAVCNLEIFSFLFISSLFCFRKSARAKQVEMRNYNWLKAVKFLTPIYAPFWEKYLHGIWNIIFENWEQWKFRSRKHGTLKNRHISAFVRLFSHSMHLLIDSLFLLLFADRLTVGRLPLPTSRCRHRFWQSNCFPGVLPKQSINTIHFCGLPSHNE